MWGQLVVIFSVLIVYRNTPTYVGTTEVPGGDIGYLPEHPHVCGDNAVGAGGRRGMIGTPPRMWGQL